MSSIQEPLAAAFNRLAPDYDSWYQTPLGALSDALDLSCGTGNYALSLSRRELRVTAIDSSGKMLEIAQTKAARERLVIDLLLWAAVRRFKGLFAPSIWSMATFFNPRKLTDLLAAAGAHAFQWKSAIYFPPFDNRWLLDRFQALEGVGQKAFPCLGAFFAVRAEK